MKEAARQSTEKFIRFCRETAARKGSSFSQADELDLRQYIDAMGIDDDPLALQQLFAMTFAAGPVRDGARALAAESDRASRKIATAADQAIARLNQQADAAAARLDKAAADLSDILKDASESPQQAVAAAVTASRQIRADLAELRTDLAAMGARELISDLRDGASALSTVIAHVKAAGGAAGHVDREVKAVMERLPDHLAGHMQKHLFSKLIAVVAADREARNSQYEQLNEDILRLANPLRSVRELPLLALAIFVAIIFAAGMAVGGWWMVGL